LASRARNRRIGSRFASETSRAAQATSCGSISTRSTSSRSVSRDRAVSTSRASLAVGCTEFGVDLTQGSEGSSWASSSVAGGGSRIVANETARASGALNGARFREGARSARNFATDTDGTDKRLSSINSSLGAVVTSLADGASGHSRNCPSTIGASDHGVLSSGRASETSRADIASSLTTSREGTRDTSNRRLKSGIGGRATITNRADGAVGAVRVAVVASRARDLEIFVDGRTVVTSAAAETLSLTTSRSGTFSTAEGNTREGVCERASVTSGATSAVGSTTFRVSTIRAARRSLIGSRTRVTRRAVVAHSISKTRVVTRSARSRSSLVTTLHTSRAQVASCRTNPGVGALGTAKWTAIDVGAHETAWTNSAADTLTIAARRARLEDSDCTSVVASVTRRTGNARRRATTREETTSSVARNWIDSGSWALRVLGASSAVGPTDTRVTTSGTRDGHARAGRTLTTARAERAVVRTTSGVGAVGARLGSLIRSRAVETRGADDTISAAGASGVRSDGTIQGDTRAAREVASA
jgi:hypothetical protein